MINAFVKIFIILIIVALQFTLMPFLEIMGVWPNLLLICVAVLALLEYPEDALLFACVAGFLSDLAGPINFGVNILFYLGLVFAIQYLLKRYISEINLFVLVLIIIITTILYCIYISLIIHVPLNQSLLYQCIYNTIVAIFFFYLFQLIYKKKLLIKIENL